MMDERIRSNVQKMIDQKAPPEHIDGYLQTEGLSREQFKESAAVEEPWYSKLGGIAKAAGAEAVNMVSGAGRKEDGIEELPSNILVGNKPVSIKELLMMGRGDNKAMVDIASKHIPGASFRQDKWGNPIIKIPGRVAVMDRESSDDFNMTPTELGNDREFYINRPGLSSQDATDYAPETVALAAGGGVGGVAGRAALGAVGQVAGTMAGTGAASVGLDKAAQGVGSKQPVNWDRVKSDSLWAGGLESAGMVAKWLGGKIFSSKLYDKATGELTERGKGLLQELGINADDMTKAMKQEFAEQASKAANPADALAVADAKTLPSKVDLTKGDLTRDVSQQAFEDSAHKGVYGERAKTIMSGARAGQQDALRENVEAIASNLGGGTRMQPGEGANAAAAALRTQAKTEKAGVNAAYEAARGSGEAIDKKPFADMVEAVGTDLRSNFDMGALPQAERLLAQAESIVSVGTKPGQGLESWRTRISNAMKTAQRNNPTEALALKKMQKGYDDMIEAQVDQGLLAGKWADAVKSRANYGKKFQSDRIIDTIVRNKVPPDQAVNYLFGAGRLGYGKQATEALEKMKGLLGETSPAWQGLKQETFLRLTRDADGPLDQSMKAMFSGTTFARNLDDAMERAPTLMRTMFSKEEMALLQQFKRTALRATNRVPGAVNHSGTATELARITQRIFGPAATAVQAIYTRFGKPAIGMGRAINATSGMSAAPKQTLLPPGVFGAGAAAAVGQENSGQRPAIRR